jgi:hypothetical protein
VGRPPLAAAPLARGRGMWQATRGGSGRGRAGQLVISRPVPGSRLQPERPVRTDPALVSCYSGRRGNAADLGGVRIRSRDGDRQPPDQPALILSGGMAGTPGRFSGEGSGQGVVSRPVGSPETPPERTPGAAAGGAGRAGRPAASGRPVPSTGRRPSRTQGHHCRMERGGGRLLRPGRPRAGDPIVKPFASRGIAKLADEARGAGAPGPPQVLQFFPPGEASSRLLWLY